ncbi:DUF2726 domain-containing protein [Blastococcus colisei]|uniref:DUF2726 domain-containing protein n=1 Tax=Blastococcus colisei TaxID=1564162 RepID=UPI001476DECF|nr:DUF2726 domain-containing protein [Blastococcus colisei]
MKPVLVNHYEKVTDRLLTSEAADNGDRLLTKVRVADVLNVDHLTGRLKGYALSAHFDFLMVEAETSIPRFAVELDGAQHWNDARQRERDRMKDALCEGAGLPLARITSDFTHRRGRWRVLSYLVDAFYMSEGFYAAQQAGHVPWDEPFMIESVIVQDDDGRSSFYAFDTDAIDRLWAHYNARRLPTALPDTWTTAVKANGMVQAHAYVAVAENRYLVARVRVRDFRFQGISPGQIASQLVVAEVGDLAERWLSGEAVACDRRELMKVMGEVQQAIDAGGFLSSFTSGGSLVPGGPLPLDATIQMRRLA